MLDYRTETFLTLCETRSYTKAAELLCVTQPAVSQQIKYLEQALGVKLFIYENKELRLTAQGVLYEKALRTMRSDTGKLLELMQHQNEPQHICFGATLTISGYVMPPIIRRFLSDFPHTRLTIREDNTQRLIESLRKGVIDFAFVEGHFEKSGFDYRLFSKERFIAVCAPDHPLHKKKPFLAGLLDEHLILREPGSGTRNVLESILYEHNLSTESFARVTEIGNMEMLKGLVAKGLGVTMLYEAAVQKELRKRKLVRLALRDFEVEREFNFICLKNSIMLDAYLQFFDYCKKYRRF